LRPVSLARAETPQFAWTYRVVEEQGRWLLQSRRDGDWNDLYAFTLEPQHQADYEMANYYTSTHPNSRFVQTLTVQLPGPDGRMILRNRELIIDTGVVSTSQLVTDDHALLEVLAERFGLRFPPGTRFPHFEQMV
jgi:N-hydroxyarylamine O-acetyltransferase